MIERHKLYTTLKARPLSEEVEAKRENLSSYFFYRLMRLHFLVSLLFTCYATAIIIQHFVQYGFRIFTKFALTLGFILLEAVRYRTGQRANIAESFPDMFAFILISLLSLALLAVLLAVPLLLIPEIVYCGLHALFILAEVLSAFLLLARFSRNKQRLLLGLRAL